MTYTHICMYIFIHIYIYIVYLKSGKYLFVDIPIALASEIRK